jgi:acetolactate synthase-1/2/3 large subunit
MLCYPILSQGWSDCVLLASSQDHDTGGGLFAWDGQTLEQVDRLSTGGLCVAGGRLFRSLWAALADAPGEILTYDERGVQRYDRLDALAGAHDVLWNGRELIAVSTATNSVLWISAAGEITRTWQAPGQGDAWHLNCLCLEQGRLLVSAFGRFTRHRDWTEHSAAPLGILFDLESGRDVLTGLVRPHHPRFVDGGWLVCNSAAQDVVHVEPETGTVRHRLALQGWTRGVALTDDYLFIGESALRRDTGRWSTASIAVVCRRTWSVLGRLPLPCREVYDLVLAPASLLQGLRRGFRTNTQRAAEQDQYALFARAGVQPVRLWASGDPLPPEACRVHIRAEVPNVVEVDEDRVLSCVVDNAGTALLVTAPPHPVHLSYKWFEAETGRWLREPEGLRMRLPHTLVPGRPATCRLKLWAPPTPGNYRLRITLVQEDVAWFDDIHPENGCEHAVEVVARQSLWKKALRLNSGGQAPAAQQNHPALLAGPSACQKRPRAG